MDQYDQAAARGIIDDINGWEIQSMKPSAKLPDAWDVTLGSTPRVVGDLLPDYAEGSEDGTVMALQPRDGTAEFDETVMLRRAPRMSLEGDMETPGIVMWGMLTCAYESRDPGTFEGTIAFYADEDQGASLMSVAATDVARRIITGVLDEIDVAISQMEGLGPHVVDHAGRILAQSGRLGRILSEGIAARNAAS
jgi:hypothetical protein